MTLRKIPAALALGLVAAFAAHTGLFGGQHAMGGSYDGLLTDLAWLGASGLAVLAAAAVFAGRFAADGSIIAARLDSHLPGLLPLTVSTIVWFGIGESLEPAHAQAALPLALVVLAISAFLILAVARTAVRWIAGAVIAIVRLAYAASEPTPISIGTPQLAFAPSNPVLRRRFARPPPSLLTIVL